MTSEVIRDVEQLRSLVPEWKRFVEQHTGSTPFHLPEWLLTWWEHFGSGELHVLVFRSDGHIGAMLPLFLHEWEGKQQLTLIGTGITDYLDPLIEPGRETDFVKAVQSYLNHLPTWERLDWTDLSPNHPLFELPDVNKQEGMPTAEISFHGAFDSFWAERGKDLRRNLRRYRERAEQVAQLRYETYNRTDPQLVANLLNLHTKRWQASGEPGMVEANQSGEFLRCVAERMSAVNYTKVFVLRFGEAISALILAFVYHGKIFAYMSAFDPDHAALGNGRTLLYEAIRDSFPRYRGWNFLRGDEAYKTQWGAQLSGRAELRLERPFAK